MDAWNAACQYLSMFVLLCEKQKLCSYCFFGQCVVGAGGIFLRLIKGLMVVGRGNYSLLHE